MMGQADPQRTLFYQLSLETFVPAEHPLRAIRPLIDDHAIRHACRDLYAPIGRPSIPPEQLFLALVGGYLLGITSERKTRASSMSPSSRRCWRATSCLTSPPSVAAAALLMRGSACDNTGWRIACPNAVASSSKSCSGRARIGMGCGAFAGDGSCGCDRRVI
jgi:hypothetical protein